MKTLTRQFRGWGIHNHGVIAVTPGTPDRPVAAVGWASAPNPTNMSGPEFKGMDPSDPSTYTRPWNPAPGMVAYLNFDGAAMQARTPTQLQRGPQSRPRKLWVGM